MYAYPISRSRSERIPQGRRKIEISLLKWNSVSLFMIFSIALFNIIRNIENSDKVSFAFCVTAMLLSFICWLVPNLSKRDVVMAVCLGFQMVIFIHIGTWTLSLELSLKSKSKVQTHNDLEGTYSSGKGSNNQLQLTKMNLSSTWTKHEESVGITLMRGLKNTSCTMACSSHDPPLKCHPTLFTLVNECSLLEEAFGCVHCDKIRGLDYHVHSREKKLSDEFSGGIQDVESTSSPFPGYLEYPALSPLLNERCYQAALNENAEDASAALSLHRCEARHVFVYRLCPCYGGVHLKV